MDPERLVDVVLRQLVTDGAACARRTAEEAWRGTADPLAGALTGFTVFMSGAVPDEPGDPAGDPTTTLLTAAVASLRVAKGSPAVEGDLLGLARTNDTSTRLGAFAHYLAAEAALATARLDLAIALREHAPDVHTRWQEHPYGPVMLACAARTEVFRGNIAAGLELLDGEAPAGVAGDLVRASKAVAAGNAADVDTMRSLIAEVVAAGVEPVDHLGRGIHLLLAFGVVALGDSRAAVGHLLAAGGGADLELLTVIDRMLGYELLVAAGVAEGDRGSAEAWRARAEIWAHDRAAAPTLHRIRARVALLSGDPVAAEEHAEAALAAAAAEHRLIEQAEAEILRATARVARRRIPDATRDLRSAVAIGDESGHHAVRVSATRVLRPARRRLPPPSGTGREALSAREQDVAALILAGADNGEIAAHLSLSPATVRTHTTRVLTAYGVATRIALLAATRPWPDQPVSPADLTPRQREVVALVAAGRSNPEIAGSLGISVKSVERHVSAILLRWDARSRFDLAHRWWAAQE